MTNIIILPRWLDQQVSACVLLGDSNRHFARNEFSELGSLGNFELQNWTISTIARLLRVFNVLKIMEGKAVLKSDILSWPLWTALHVYSMSTQYPLGRLCTHLSGYHSHNISTLSWEQQWSPARSSGCCVFLWPSVDELSLEDVRTGVRVGASLSSISTASCLKLWCLWSSRMFQSLTSLLCSCIERLDGKSP